MTITKTENGEPVEFYGEIVQEEFVEIKKEANERICART